MVKKLVWLYGIVCLVVTVSASKEDFPHAIAIGAAETVIVPGVIIGTVLGRTTGGPVWGLSIAFWLCLYLYMKKRSSAVSVTGESAPSVPRMVALVRRRTYHEPFDE